ncbi:MAG: hypothetical protein HYZ48_05020 [Chlamydiales bacterium]|nr:hypothetical protein [Chlamydiales bacterium]
MKPMIEDLVPFHQKEFSTLIACNKASNYPGELYSQRRYLIHFFEIIAPHHFSLFGKWWPQALQTYRGPIEKKCDVLKHFRFCFAYENIQHIPGYVTEKIFDCFQAGVVPIYWGAPNISSTIPKNCYIPREEFADNASLLYHLENMDETTYNLYLKNIRNYLGSERAKLYSKEHFISLFIEAIKR